MFRGLLDVILRDTSIALSTEQSTADYKPKMAIARRLIVQGLDDRPLRAILSQKRDLEAM